MKAVKAVQLQSFCVHVQDARSKVGRHKGSMNCLCQHLCSFLMMVEGELVELRIKSGPTDECISLSMKGNEIARFVKKIILLMMIKKREVQIGCLVAICRIFQERRVHIF